MVTVASTSETSPGGLTGFVMTVLAQRGRLDLVWLLTAATIGSVVGAWLLYFAGARLGPERAARAPARLPLVDS